MALWEEILGPAALGGVELPVVSRRISGGRAVARKRLPYVSGQETENTGREARVLDVQVALFNDMREPDLYPERYEELVGVLSSDEDNGVVRWDDPVWGPMLVQVVKWEVDENSEERDGARISMTLEEEGFQESTNLAISLLTANDRSDAETQAAEFDELIDELAVTGGEVETAWEGAGYKKKAGESTSFLTTVNAVFTSIDEGQRRADEVAAEVNRFQARVESVLRLPAVAETVEGWAALDVGTRLIDSVAQSANATLAEATRVIDFEVTGPMSVFDVALRLYRDPDRVDEIIAANPMATPLYIPVGTVLKVLEE